MTGRLSRIAMCRRRAVKRARCPVCGSRISFGALACKRHTNWVKKREEGIC